MMYNNSLYGLTRNFKFGDLWDSHQDFVDDYNDSAFPSALTDEKLALLFYLLYAQYGYSTSATPNREQFKYKVFSIIYMYGPTWEKKLEIQEKLRNLTDEEIMMGATQIAQHGYNPSTAVSSEDLIETVDDQNKVKYKKSKIEGYANLLTLLKADVTKEFIDRFKVLFRKVCGIELPLWYETTVDEEGEEE